MPELTQYAGDGRGARGVGFVIDGIQIAVRPSDRTENEAAWSLAGELATSRARLAVLTEDRDRLAARVADLHAQVPDNGARLLGRACVRFVGGEMWMLNRREGGLKEFGFRFKDWDELFRRWNVRVVAHGTDATGAWWDVENFTVKEEV